MHLYCFIAFVYNCFGMCFYESTYLTRKKNGGTTAWLSQQRPLLKTLGLYTQERVRRLCGPGLVAMADSRHRGAEHQWVPSMGVNACTNPRTSVTRVAPRRARPETADRVSITQVYTGGVGSANCWLSKGLFGSSWSNLQVQLTLPSIIISLHKGIFLHENANRAYRGED
jgi:hypothetical protein